jgi:apolipoprotein N-acyltransferase
MTLDVPLRHPALDALSRRFPQIMGRLETLWPHLMSLWGLRALMGLAGAMAAFAHPPFGFLPGILGYGLFLYGLERDLGPRPLKRAFFFGWLAGFVYFLISCFWVAEAFLVDAKTYGWMAPFAVCLLPAMVGVFWGFTALVYRWLEARGLWRGLVFCALFSCFEILRGWIFTGFPWNPAGATWLAGSWMSQLASVFGVYGLGFITVFIGVSPFVVSLRRKVRGFAPVMLAAAVLAVGLGFGAYRVATTPVTDSDYLVRIVQPNVGQKAKWTRGAFTEIFADYFRMTRAPLALTEAERAAHPDKRRPDMVIWPEGALPLSSDELFSAESWTSEAMTRLLADRQVLVMGAYRGDYDAHLGSVWRNSLLVLQQKGPQTHVVAVYNKYKLVPFGEFLPFEAFLTKIGVKSLVNVGDGFTPGVRTASMQPEGVPRFLPLICFEGLFPDLDAYRPRASYDPARPKWIINISNDAWFGPTTGPRQHLNLSSYRAIEEGIPLIRSTPTGISALIDPLGRRVASKSLNLGEAGFRDVLIPHAVNTTLHAQHRHLPALLTLIFVLMNVTKKVISYRVSKKTVFDRTKS